MRQKDVIRHQRFDTPCYYILVHHRPNLGQHKPQYMSAVKDAALEIIPTPITTNDVEIEILYSTFSSEGTRADADNIIKPTLDGLIGVGFNDDKQVRSVTSTVFDKNIDNVVDGRVEHMGPLLRTHDKHVILICVYSDTRLQELGGEQLVREKRLSEFLGKMPPSVQVYVKN